MGWADPWTFTVDADHTVTAFCVPIQSFPGLRSGQPCQSQPGSGHPHDRAQHHPGLCQRQLSPNDTTQRAQMAAIICRGMGFDHPQTWDTEDHGNPFIDRNGLDVPTSGATSARSTTMWGAAMTAFASGQPIA